MKTQGSLFILGAGGFIGRRLVLHALRANWKVTALVRTEQQARWMRDQGANPLIGDAENADTWSDRLAGHTVLVDLIQPRLPSRLTRGHIRRIASLRVEITRNVLQALTRLPANQRPYFFSLSGCNDLQPNASGRVHAASPLRMQANGFGQIGIPVRHTIEAAGVAPIYLYLGHVYGPGKAFGETILPAIARGKFPIIGKGDGRLPLVHVDDVARAIVHLATMDLDEWAGKQVVISDGVQTTLAEMVTTAAELAGASPPRHVPIWLAKLASGSVMVNEMLDDIFADPTALLHTGFRLRYPIRRDGLRATMAELGLLPPSSEKQEYA